MMHCDLRVRWKVASDLRFRAAISEPKTPSCCGISGDLALSMRKSLAIAIARFWCARARGVGEEGGGVGAQPRPRRDPRTTFSRYCVFGKCIGLLRTQVLATCPVLLSSCVCLVLCGLVCYFKNGQVLGHNFWGISLVLG